MNRRLQADLALAVCSFLWGITFVIVQSALDDASVLAFMLVRFTVAAVLMAVIYRRDLRALTMPEFRAGFQIGLLMFIGFSFQTAGLLSTTPSNAAFITGFGVVLIPVFLALFWRRRINVWVWAGAVVSFAGLYGLTVPASGISGLHRGDLLVLACSVAFAFHIIYIGKAIRRFSVGALSFLQVATTAVLSLPALGIAGATGIELPRWHATTRLLVAVFVTAVLSTALAFSIQVWAQQHTTPTHTALILTLEPVFAALTSFVVLGERLGGRALTGMALILVGILFAELKGPVQAAADSSWDFGNFGG